MLFLVQVVFVNKSFTLKAIEFPSLFDLRLFELDLAIHLFHFKLMLLFWAHLKDFQFVSFAASKV